jgi:hypothetical protein
LRQRQRVVARGAVADPALQRASEQPVSDKHGRMAGSRRRPLSDAVVASAGMRSEQLSARTELICTVGLNQTCMVSMESRMVSEADQISIGRNGHTLDVNGR